MDKLPEEQRRRVVLTSGAAKHLLAKAYLNAESWLGGETYATAKREQYAHRFATIIRVCEIPARRQLFQYFHRPAKRRREIAFAVP
ncbi:MAG: hypothetical protein ACLSGF_06355 [Alistipes onderdonkii]